MDDLDTRNQKEVLIAQTKKAIADAYTARTNLEYSDDFCFSNGRYDEQTVYIRQLEKILEKLNGDS